MATEIKNVQGLISQYIGPNKKVVSNEITNLTAPGDNYLSVVLKVDIVLEDESTGNEEILYAVGKCIHLADVNKFLQEASKMGYKNESAFYSNIVPALKKFVSERNLQRDFDIFPQLIAYRPNLHGENGEVDENSILLLENIKILGYDNIDRQISFDLESAQIILKDLASFHAVPIAMKLKQRHAFESKVKKYIPAPFFGPPTQNEDKMPSAPPPVGGPTKMWFDLLEQNPSCKLYIPRLRQIVAEFRTHIQEKSKRPKREPFATLCHSDMWVNNTMQIFEDGKLVKNKFVDFQTYTYDSPGLDILFFIWSSIQLPVLKQNFNHLLKYYHSNFVEVLQELGCDISSFSYDKFEIELKESALDVLFKCFIMFLFIFGKKGSFAVDLSVAPDELSFPEECFSDSMKDRAALMIQVFGRNGWI